MIPSREILVLIVNRNPITDVIAIETEKLREKWLAFQTNCPQEERLDLQTSEPTVDSVVDLVSQLMKSWKTEREKGRRGKVMAGFHKFCRGLDSHSAMLKILPEGNEYVSIFTGTLGAVVKVYYGLVSRL
jgi:hypothetical protein